MKFETSYKIRNECKKYNLDISCSPSLVRTACPFVEVISCYLEDPSNVLCAL